MQLISKKNTLIFLSSALVIGAAVYAAQWKWHIWKKTSQGNDAPALINPPADETPVLDEASNNDTGIKEVLSAHLFGREDAAKQPNLTEPLPKTQQPLELHGIIYIPQRPERSRALIAETGKEAHLYKTDDEIPSLPGYKIASIDAESVKLEHDGMVELLELPRKFPDTANTQPTGMEMSPNDGTVTDAPLPEEIPQPVPEALPPDNPEVPPPPQNVEVPPPPEMPPNVEPPPVSEAIPGQEPPPPAM